MSGRQELKSCIKNLRQDTTIKVWAIRNGFKYQTVVKVLNGYAGKRQIGVAGDIINKLRTDGYLKECCEGEGCEDSAA